MLTIQPERFDNAPTLHDLSPEEAEALCLAPLTPTHDEPRPEVPLEF